jgi:uncharacterized caspase-like protein
MRRALCAGIDQYAFGPLSGCAEDATRIASVLSQHEDGSPNFDCRTLLAPQGGSSDAVTLPVLRDQLERLFKDPADVALFHFSGHGTTNNLDGFLVTQDAKKYSEGVEMSHLLRLANDSKAKEVVILIDCCFAGSFGNVPAVDNTKSLLREGVSILTAARGDQVSLETGGGGVFTSLVVDALQGGAANLLGAVTGPAIYSYVESALGAWDQRPLFKSHVSSVLELRRCTPPIARSILRRLPQIFPLPAEDLQLDPSFEPTSAKPVAGNVAKFDDLQALNRQHLVVPVAERHMYDVATKSGTCRLTPTGRYYWRLAKDGRV